MAKRGGDDVGLPDRPSSRPREEAMEVDGDQQMDTGAGLQQLSGDMDAPASGSEIITVGSIKYNKKHLLGKGTDGTRVFMYYHMEQDEHFCYIALELALGSVEDYVKGKYEGPKIDDISILRQASNGLKWLHSRKIMHRNVKPTNILLVENKKGEVVIKLSEFGLSKELPESSTTRMTTGVGSQDWRAPETSTPGRNSEFAPAQDVFSMGCVVYYVLSKGEHPFGREELREGNIQLGNYSLSAVEDISGRAVIEEMIQSKPEARPSAEHVGRHPFLWQMKETKEFIQIVSDALQGGKDEELNTSVEKHSCLVFGGTEAQPRSWKEIVVVGLYTTKKDSKYLKDKSLAQLIRLIRNKLVHFGEISEETRSIVGHTEDELMQYMTEKFPGLVLHVWLAASVRREVEKLKKYYSSDFTTSRYDAAVAAAERAAAPAQ